MKSYCKGLEVDRDLVARAYEAWLGGESGHKNGWRVEAEHGSADALVEEILWETTCRTLTFEPIHRYEHREPTNGKVRTIGVESVKQQVCDYVAVLALKPLLEAKLGFYQVAAVKGKGQRLCRGALRRWSHDARYHVKGDVRKCYPSISHDVVMRMLRRYVRSADVLYLCETLLGTYDRGGLEIGSYFSLQMANLVLSSAYHHVESLGRRRRGRWVPMVRHQIWHMDDFLLIGTSKRDLRMAMRAVERYMREELGIEIKPWKVARTSRREPLDLGGWVVRELGTRREMPDGTTRVDESDRHTRVTLRDGIFLRGTRSFRYFVNRPSPRWASSCMAYWGWFKHGDCEGARRRRGIDRACSRARMVISRHARRARSEALDGKA